MKTSLSPLRRSLRRGFTLVEVLVVLAIIAIIMFLAVPNMGGIIGGSKLTQAADMLRYDLAVAQQTAIKENIPIEVRFYNYKDPDYTDTSKPVYTAYEIFRLRPDLENLSNPMAPRIKDPLIAAKKLPAGIVIPESTKWSTLVSHEQVPTGQTAVRGLIPTEKRTDATYRSYQINADGETNLDKTGRESWYVTLVQQQDLTRVASANEMKPTNYITLQVDAFSGAVRWFQPH